MEYSVKEYKQWRRGVLIQKAFKTCNDDQREFLMTGLTPCEWDRAFIEFK